MEATTTETTELRWFAPGRGPALSRGRWHHRVDRYHVESLSPDSAVKPRGRRARLEVKVLVGHDEAIELAGATWYPERWLKSGQFEWQVSGYDGWITVDKRICRSEGVEVSLIDLDGTPWWSLALNIRGSNLGPVSSPLVHHLEAAGDGLVCCSYPAWLLSQLPPSPIIGQDLATALRS
jgi:hypothetical protein